MGQPVRELAVVGEQDQARAVGVEPPHGIEPAVARRRGRRRSAVPAGRARSRARRGACSARRRRAPRARRARLAVDLDPRARLLAASPRRAPGRARPRRRCSRGLLRSGARRRGARRRPRGRGTWPGAPRDAQAACGPLRRARFARAQQPLAQLGGLLRRGVEARDVGQLLERAQAEELQEGARGAVERGAELRAAGLLDQVALLQARDGVVGVDAADARDLRAARPAAGRRRSRASRPAPA